MRIALLVFAFLVESVSAMDFSSELGVEGRRYLEEGAYPHQVDDQWSFSWQPEFVWDADSSSFILNIFTRKDFSDESRSHTDIREAMWQTWGGNWELNVGVGKVFWGVTESIQIVDLVNQVDFVESVDNDEKLGQPMVHWSYLGDTGTYELLALPGFRERTFPGEAGRFRPGLPLSNSPIYQANAGRRHTDFAARWSHYYDVFGGSLDISAVLFRGTGREPAIILEETEFDGELFVTDVIPYYMIQNQAGLTLQFAPEGWLIKAEVLHSDIQDDEYEDRNAVVTGFEYTFVGPFELDFDLGLVMEYQYDSRGKGNAANQNDLFIGARHAFYDMNSSEILIGITQDLDYNDSRLYAAEASTRINSYTKFEFLMAILESDEDDELQDIFKKDDFVQASLIFYF